MKISAPFLPIEIEVRRRRGHPVRVGVRHLMFLVFAVAIGIHAWTNPARSRSYRQAAAYHESQFSQLRWVAEETTTNFRARFVEARAMRSKVEQAERQGDSATVVRLGIRANDLEGVAGSIRSRLTGLEARARYHWALHEKYRAASSQAWWPLWPDPPSP